MNDRILVWIENRSTGLVYKSAIWDFALDEEGQLLANAKFDAFQNTVTRRDIVGTAKMAWSEGWKTAFRDEREDLAEQALVIQSCVSPPKEGLQDSRTKHP